MPAMKEPEPRRHHYVPQCWLAGFTDTGEKDGQLWVTDLVRRKQWQASPNNAGHIRDFYRLSDEQLDPVMAKRPLRTSKRKSRQSFGFLTGSSVRPVWKNLVLYCPLLHFSGRTSKRKSRQSFGFLTGSSVRPVWKNLVLYCPLLHFSGRGSPHFAQSS